jgi:hypothetical protein
VDEPIKEKTQIKEKKQIRKEKGLKEEDKIEVCMCCMSVCPYVCMMYVVCFFSPDNIRRTPKRHPVKGTHRKTNKRKTTKKRRGIKSRGTTKRRRILFIG